MRKKKFQTRAKILSVYVYILTHLHAARRIFKKFYSDCFFWFFKKIEIFGFLGHTQPA